MPRVALAALTLVLGCHAPEFEIFQEQQEQFASNGSDGAAETTTAATPTSTGGIGSEAAGATGDTPDATDTADVTGLVSDSSDTGIASATTGDTEAPAALPSIVSVKIPAKVHAAGPVPVEVQAKDTMVVQLRLDGADAGELVAAGGELFTGTLPVYGAIDNGIYEVEIIARQGDDKDTRTSYFEVSTPKPGTMAWFQAGPAGSRTNRVALAADGGVLEAGRVEINKVTRPGLRKRSGLTGAELWSVTLDSREGEVADLSVLPDGRVWVAMNVRKPGNLSPQPRIALFDAAGVFTGIEAFGDIGQGVRSIAADADGGCFAGGFASAGNDLDIAYWRIDGAGTQTLSAMWDYVPIDEKPHKFSEFAMDVVIEGDVVWVVGASNGKHEAPKIETFTRGILVPMNLHTGEVVAPVIVAPKSDPYTQSAFFGAAHHPLGVLVTGYGCDNACADYQIETSLYGPTGLRLWHTADAAGAGKRYGSDVVIDSQGRALVSGAVTDKGVLRGYVFAHHIDGKGLPLFEHWFPASAAASEALGLLVDDYDRPFVGGYITTNGATQARLLLLHP